LPTKALAISTNFVDTLARKLRQTDPPVIARIEANQLLLDPRTVLPEQDKTLLALLENALIGQPNN
jgi:L-seryl-tRNA(Ser) seleniumtransferase